MNQINNIQVGNQTYQIGGTGSGSASGGSAVVRGESAMVIADEASGLQGKMLLVRPNSISSVVMSDTDVAAAVIGLPHEIAQESGELWNISGIIPIIVSHDSTDIPGYPHKATISIPAPEDSSEWISGMPQNGMLGSLLNINSFGGKICVYCTSKFLEATSQDMLILRECLMDGTVLVEETMTGDMLSQMWQQLGYPTTGETMVVGCMVSMLGRGVTAVACDIVETPGSEFPYSFTLNVDGSSFDLYAKSLEPGSPFFDGQDESAIVGFIAYIGPSYMKVDPTSHYMLNINISSESMFITNIPVAWANNTPPTFSQDRLVQISVLDGVGTFNEVVLPDTSE